MEYDGVQKDESAAWKAGGEYVSSPSGEVACELNELRFTVKTFLFERSDCSCGLSNS